jgi:predicted ribosome quality control (RQC) complex YloA/Tae2 family protein
MSLDGLSMHPLVVELNQQLSGGRIDKIFQPNKNTIVLLIRKPGKNYVLHISINPQNPVINLIEKTIDNPASPPTFCMVLRKQVEDGRIAEFRQHSLDRIVSIGIDIRGVGGTIITKTLIIELMGKYSNLILIQDGIIINSIKKIGITTSRVRQVLPGIEYSLPPGQDKLNILEISSKQFVEKLVEYQSLTLTKAIIYISIGIGPVTAKEIAWLAHLPNDILISELSQSAIKALEESIQILIDQIKNNNIKPIVVTNVNKKLLAIAAFPLEHLHEHIPYYFDTISGAVDFSTEISGSYVIPDKEIIKKLVSAELAKLNNKLDVLQSELSQAYNAESFKNNADILMTYQYQANYEKSDQIVVLPNLYSETPETDLVTITINPLLSISKNAQQYYNKYNKLKRAQELLTLQVNLCKQDILYLLSIENSLVTSNTLIEINEIKSELISAGYLNDQKKKKTHEKPSKPLKIIASDNTIILIGKNNYQNDDLTFKQAQRNDIWLHTKDIPGSHVIIRCETEQPTEDILLLAAQLSAYFSKARNSSKIPVDYTKRHYVKKPAKSKPGFVIYTNQKTLYVTPDNKFIEKLILQNNN